MPSPVDRPAPGDREHPATKLALTALERVQTTGDRQPRLRRNIFDIPRFDHGQPTPQRRMQPPPQLGERPLVTRPRRSEHVLKAAIAWPLTHLLPSSLTPTSPLPTSPVTAEPTAAMCVMSGQAERRRRRDRGRSDPVPGTGGTARCLATIGGGDRNTQGPSHRHRRPAAPPRPRRYHRRQLSATRRSPRRPGGDTTHHLTTRPGDQFTADMEFSCPPTRRSAVRPHGDPAVP